MQYFFELGRNRDLSRAEIEHVFAAEKIPFHRVLEDKNIFIIEVENTLDSAKIMEKLGGTLKIARLLSSDTSIESIAENLQTLQTEGKIQFSLSGNTSKEIALQVKKHLKSLGRSVRYIEAKNTATILHNNLIEKQGDLTLTPQGLFLTEAIQAIEEWGERDFGRPGRDSRSGMLPPKLARMMIHLSDASPSEILLDPFCGSGTILTEAISLGFQKLIGSDTSEKAIEDTKKNIEWMKAQMPEGQKISIKTLLSDAASIHSKLQKDSVGAIATEPYMGRPLKGTEEKSTLQKQARELQELYLSAFESFQKILRPGGSIVCIIPRFFHEKTWIRIHCLEQIQSLGFSLERLTPTEPSILYHRPDQFVGREIWKFRKI